jgi:hypothetical protein
VERGDREFQGVVLGDKKRGLSEFSLPAHCPRETNGVNHDRARFLLFFRIRLNVTGSLNPQVLSLICKIVDGVTILDCPALLHLTFYPTPSVST